MKKSSFLIAGIAGFIANLAVSPAMAENLRVEEALKNRPELHNFYQALVNTGVNRELLPNYSYTIFAPTNEALARISPAQYPCFYDQACSREVASILRNHIVPGEVHLNHAVNRMGGLHSVDNRFIPIGEPFRNNYTVDGKNVLSASQLAGGMLYRIDGVIANDRELAQFQYPNYAVYPTREGTYYGYRYTPAPVYTPAR